MFKKGRAIDRDHMIRPEEAFKDPYILEILNLKDQYSESDLEEALIKHLETFFLELGRDFCFMGRQRRLRIGDAWYQVDLVFYHRRLKCIVIIDLKLGKFIHADASQIHLYLNYVKENWVEEGENPPIGLILCAQRDETVAQYALDGLPNKIMASEYRTVLPDEKQITTEIERARIAIETSEIVSESNLSLAEVDQGFLNNTEEIE